MNRGPRSNINLLAYLGMCVSVTIALMNHVNHSQLLNNGEEKEGKAGGTLNPLYRELCVTRKSVSVLQLASLQDISFPSKYCFFRGSCCSQETLRIFIKPNSSRPLEAVTEG